MMMLENEQENTIPDEEQQKELTPAEIYNLEQRKIRDEMENRLPRIADKVLVDIEWTPECGIEPNPTMKATILGLSYNQYYVRLQGGSGSMLYVYPEATILRHD
jgi:hypothetical protein